MHYTSHCYMRSIYSIRWNESNVNRGLWRERKSKYCTELFCSALYASCLYALMNLLSNGFTNEFPVNLFRFIYIFCLIFLHKLLLNIRKLRDFFVEGESKSFYALCIPNHWQLATKDQRPKTEKQIPISKQLNKSIKI